MEKFAVITDSNSGILPEEAAARGVGLVMMPFLVDGEEFQEFGALSYEEFFARMGAGADVSTSQPSPADVIAAWEKGLEKAERVVYLPMSSGLSSSCASAQALATDYDGRVLVIDNKRISVNLRAAVEDALSCRDSGMDAGQAAEYLKQTAMDTDVYVAVNTLEYLKKSGRVTPAGAAIGSLLGIKPVLRIHGDKLDAYKKVRGMVAAMDAMLDAVALFGEQELNGQKITVRAAYSGDRKLGEEWRALVAARFPQLEVGVDALPVSISCHVGPGALGIGISKIR